MKGTGPVNSEKHVTLTNGLTRSSDGAKVGFGV